MGDPKFRRIQRELKLHKPDPRLILPEPLIEFKRLVGSGCPVSDLFSATEQLGRELKKELEKIGQLERDIRGAYNLMSAPDRAAFLSMIYSRFAENYDRHMGIETGHYQAMRFVLRYAHMVHRFGFPLLDVTAGTGELIRYAMELDNGNGLICANDLSEKMLAKAKEKLGNGRVFFHNHDACCFPDEWEGKFRTVLLSQTLNLLTDEDKIRLITSVKKVMDDGGKVIVIEEDPFGVTQTDAIQSVAMFIRGVGEPITPSELNAFFVTSGFTRYPEHAVAEIDGNHNMKVYIFTRK
ncbi:class I SAM-dependent methyltransferase [Candidatus Micrarchaeota archaeon]|nr:class I SAM-dependent methyltransferase [Candidatus Micrarchaeota archaeon]MBU1886089.1 class I SAM-dependent methyltransferase [Candidatus Micrarchaeota archaeon]